MHPHLAGILLAVVAIAVINTSDAVAKWLLRDFPVFHVMLAQAAGLAILSLVVARQVNPLRVVPTPDPLWQFARSACLFAAAFTFYSGLGSLQFAELVAILFIAPLAITAMAHVFLGEHVGVRRWCACATGCLGGIVIVRPGTDVMGWTALWPVSAVLFWSGYIVITRLVSPRNSTGNMMLWGSLVSLAVLIVTIPWYWVPVEPWHLAGLCAVGLLSASSNGLTIRAYTLAPASLLAPFIYVEIVGATLYGWFFWREFPDVWTWVGASVICASGLYVLRREALAIRARK